MRNEGRGLKHQEHQGLRSEEGEPKRATTDEQGWTQMGSVSECGSEAAALVRPACEPAACGLRLASRSLASRPTTGCRKPRRIGTGLGCRIARGKACRFSRRFGARPRNACAITTGGAVARPGRSARPCGKRCATGIPAGSPDGTRFTNRRANRVRIGKGPRLRNRTGDLPRNGGPRNSLEGITAAQTGSYEIVQSRAE